MRLFVQLLFFLMLVDDGTTNNVYARTMVTPFSWVRAVVFFPIGPVRVCDLLLAATLAVALFSGSARRPAVKPMVTALWVALATTGFSLLHGIASGGGARPAGWQSYLLLTLVLAAFTFGAVLRTAEHFLGLAGGAVAAGVYHAVMALLFYGLYVRTGAVSMVGVGDYLSSHDDTVLWCFGICYLLLRAIETPRRATRLAALTGIPLLLVATQLNHRRLAWISLGGGLLALYALWPKTAGKRRLRRALLLATPLLALYVFVGLGRSEAIFRPLRSFQTVAITEDKSTLARNAENLGLLATARQNWFWGTGWGHGYIELTDKYQIHFFELWPFVPHNSVLGLLAYTGYLGFVGYWMMWPTAGFLLARMARAGKRPSDRIVGRLGFAGLVVCADQWYGDMGSFSVVTDYLLASCLAMALRLPIAAGVWPGRPPRSGARPAPSELPGDPAGDTGWEVEEPLGQLPGAQAVQ